MLPSLENSTFWILEAPWNIDTVLIFPPSKCSTISCLSELLQLEEIIDNDNIIKCVFNFILYISNQII